MEDEDGLSIVTFRNFVLCKALLPFTLRALYMDVGASDPQRVAQLCAAFTVRPELMNVVRSLWIGAYGCEARGDWLADRGKEGQLEELLTGAGELLR
jgi:hypothetical protein